MTCQEMVNFLMAYLDEELSPDERRDFDAHLAECPPCVVYLDTYREATAMGRSVCANDDPVPDEVPEELVQAILQTRRP